jgi:pyruvate dehydrogenase E1 component
LAAQGDIKPKLIQEAIDKYQINDVRAADAGNTEGSG